MRIKLSFLFSLLFFANFHLFAQDISGFVKDESGKSLSFVNIIVKESEHSDKILFFTKTDKEGKFMLYKKDINEIINYNFYIVASLNGYNEEIKRLTKSESSQLIKLNFILNKIQVQELKEIVVTGKIPKFKISKDTISFKVTEYIDGSETRIEDVIKNLPGINVNSTTGEILYKGKSIETVTLDGDNLFGFNYILGTKNINVDMVEQIEAIDNYTENPLLKDIEQGGKVSLNLKLKKNKTNYSGNILTGLGMFDLKKVASNLKGNFLMTSAKLKSFATIAQNNTGINNSPFDYFGFNLNVEQQKENNYFARKNISETNFLNAIGMSRANINSQFFSNYNAVFKLNPKLSVKTNLYYLKDKINTNQLIQNNFIINNQNFTTEDNTFITKKPKQYRSDLQIKYNTSKTSLLDYNLRLRQENIETPTTIIQNQNKEFSSFLNTDDFYLKQDLLWTKKLSSRKALQVSFFHSFNNIPQTLIINPSTFVEDALSDTQESKFKKTFLESKATYLVSGKRDKYTFELGKNLNQSPFVSKLFNSQGIISENNFNYSQSNTFNNGAYNFNRGKWQISPSYSLRLINQNLEQNLTNQKYLKNNFIFEPALNLKYKLNSDSFLSANLGYNQNTNIEQFFFLNQVLIDNRTTVSNLPSLELQKIQSYSLLFFKNDLYKQFEIKANLSFQKSVGNFFTNQNITENTTRLEYFFLPQDNNNWNIEIQSSKYIPFIESTIKFTTNYSIFNFKNIVNNSNLRQNQNNFFSNSFFWKTAFDAKINLENTFTYQFSKSKSESQSAFINKLWKNNFKIIVKPTKNWFFNLSSEYFLPNTDQANLYFIFLDANIIYKPKNKKWNTSLSINNLTNENVFEQVQTSDISTTIFKSNLIQRYFLINLTRNF